LLLKILPMYVVKVFFPIINVTRFTLYYYSFSDSFHLTHVRKLSILGRVERLIPLFLAHADKVN